MSVSSTTGAAPEDISLEWQDVSTLLSLAAMWGISFIFMRVVAPQIGWAWAADLRVALGAMLIGVIMIQRRLPLHLRRDWQHYLVLGAINSAIPFALFAVAAMHIPAAYSAIGNATAPLWAALIGIAFTRERQSLKKIGGLGLGLLGVVVTTGGGSVGLSTMTLLAFLGTLLAALLYAIAGSYMKTRAKHIEPMALGCGSQLAATLWLMPALPFFMPAAVVVDFKLIACVLGSGLLSTGLPYVLYFPLMRRIGVMRAMTVTFLVPCFAILWAWLFLAEAVSWRALLGVLMVLLGVYLALGLDKAREPRT
jgi:drug/metabolite transporter (DMT)-like permease